MLIVMEDLAICSIPSPPERFDSSDSGISDLEYTSDDYKNPSYSDGKLDNFKNEVKETSKQLAEWVISEMTHKKTSNLPSELRKYIPTLKKTVDKILNSHGLVFQRMIRHLNLGNSNSSKQCLKRVAEDLFKDDVINWGRIVTLYAFAGEMARTLQPKYGDKLGEDIAKELGSFASSRLSAWIVREGGWSAMNEFFVEENPSESVMWKGLLCTIVGLGAIATTALVMR